MCKSVEDLIASGTFIVAWRQWNLLLMLYNLAERLLVFRVRPRGLSCFICNIVHSFVYSLVDFILLYAQSGL